MGIRPPQAVGDVLNSFIEDIEAWAEGDLVADDGLRLKADDLTSYLIEEGHLPPAAAQNLTPPLMEIYRRRLARGLREEGHKIA